MTEPSKYQIAIDAIRTSDDAWLWPWVEAVGIDVKFVTDVRDLSKAILVFKQLFPKWWFRIGDCSVSADATIAPELGGVDFEFEAGSVWDDGFMFDGRYDTDHQPSCAKSLLIVMLMALEALEAKQ